MFLVVKYQINSLFGFPKYPSFIAMVLSTYLCLRILTSRCCVHLCHRRCFHLCHLRSLHLCHPWCLHLCHPRSLHLCHPRSLHLCHPRCLHLCRPRGLHLCHPQARVPRGHRVLVLRGGTIVTAERWVGATAIRTSAAPVAAVLAAGLSAAGDLAGQRTVATATSRHRVRSAIGTET